MAATRIEVAASAGAYPVIVGTNTLDTLPEWLDSANLDGTRLFVSSPAVWNLHGPRITRVVKGSARRPILVPDGERSKNLQTVGRVYEALITAGAERSVVVIAVGGGVIGDLVGFAAATYLRGVRLVHVPTSVLAQVDSAIGGKVGVNHALGKNLIGAFHALIIVLSCSDGCDVQHADAQTLITLLHLREMREQAHKDLAIVSEMLDVRNLAIS